MRVVVLSCLLVPLVSVAQYPTLENDRLTIEITVGRVMNSYGDTEPVPGAIPKALAYVHDAMAILGVKPNEFYLRISDEVEYLECSRETTQMAQICTHNTYGRPDTYHGVQSWNDLIAALPRPSTFEVIKLWMLLRSQDWPWFQISGITSRTVVYRQCAVYDHRTLRHCSIMAIEEVATIAHELGHCRSLVHND